MISQTDLKLFDFVKVGGNVEAQVTFINSDDTIIVKSIWTDSIYTIPLREVEKIT